MKNTASTSVVGITEEALKTIEHEALLSQDGKETGGILLGVDGPTGVNIVHAGGPGPNARREPDRFLRDLQHAQKLAQAAWIRDRSQWIGEWHTHPSGQLDPSYFDISSYFRHLTDPELGFQQFVAIIVAVAPARPISAATWIISKDNAGPLSVSVAKTSLRRLLPPAALTK